MCCQLHTSAHSPSGGRCRVDARGFVPPAPGVPMRAWVMDVPGERRVCITRNARARTHERILTHITAFLLWHIVQAGRERHLAYPLHPPSSRSSACVTAIAMEGSFKKVWSSGVEERGGGRQRSGCPRAQRPPPDAPCVLRRSCTAAGPACERAARGVLAGCGHA